MRIRRAVPEDRDQLLDLWERSVRATHGFLAESDVIALRPLVARELASDATAWWVLVSGNDVPVGFLGYTPKTIEALFIDPAHLGQGGGRLLVEHAQALAGDELAVDVNEQNEAGRQFYEKMGFTVISRSPTDSGGRPFPLLHLKRAVRVQPD